MEGVKKFSLFIDSLIEKKIVAEICIFFLVMGVQRGALISGIERRGFEPDHPDAQMCVLILLFE